jgi:raffinose/stachyose/melibiose transport system substrate-binding protein
MLDSKRSHGLFPAVRLLGTRVDEGAFFASGGSMKHKVLAAVSVLGLVAGATIGGSVLAQQKKEIVFWHIQSTEPGLSLTKKQVDRYMAANPDVNVQVVPLQNDAFKTKIKVAVGAGEAPCIFPSWGGGPLYEYVKANQIIDLTAMLNEGGYKNRFLNAAFSAITFDKKIYGVPVENVAVSVFYYNKAMFTKLGIKEPQTLNELVAAAKKLKANGITPFSLANKSKWTGSMYFMYMVDRLGGAKAFVSAATRAKGGSFQNPVFIRAGKMLQDWVKAGYFNEGFNGLDYDSGQSRALLYADKAAMELMGNWSTSIMGSENPEFLKKSGIFPFPVTRAGTAGNVVGTVGDNYYSISSACKYPKEAFEMIKYLIDDKAVAERGEAGRIPPVKGFTPKDPDLKNIVDLVANAPGTQLWYDQYLPPELGEAHKDTTQALMGLTITPEQAAQTMEETAKRVMGK